MWGTSQAALVGMCPYGGRPGHRGRPAIRQPGWGPFDVRHGAPADREGQHAGQRAWTAALGIEQEVHLLDGDLTDLSSLLRVFKEAKPTEVYDLAAQSFVKSSWQTPLLTVQVTGLGVCIVLEALQLA